MSVRTVAIGVLAWLAVAALPAQEREDRTLLSHDQMRASLTIKLAAQTLPAPRR